MNKVIGIMAHVDAGKTTFSEQLLYKYNSIRSIGRVDYGTSYLDRDETEMKRGITIFAAQAEFTIGNNRYFLVHRDILIFLLKWNVQFLYLIME